MKCAKLLMKTEKESLKLTENKAFRLITEKIKKSKKVLLIGHRSPDLDCVGSLVSFFYVLKSREKDVRVLSDFKHSAWTNFNNPPRYDKSRIFYAGSCTRHTQDWQVKRIGLRTGEYTLIIGSLIRDNPSLQ